MPYYISSTLAKSALLFAGYAHICFARFFVSATSFSLVCSLAFVYYGHGSFACTHKLNKDNFFTGKCFLQGTFSVRAKTFDHAPRQVKRITSIFYVFLYILNFKWVFGRRSTDLCFYAVHVIRKVDQLLPLRVH